MKVVVGAGTTDREIEYLGQNLVSQADRSNRHRTPAVLLCTHTDEHDAIRPRADVEGRILGGVAAVNNPTIQDRHVLGLGTRAAFDGAAAAVLGRPTVTGTAGGWRTALVRRLDAHPTAARCSARLTVAGRTAALDAGAELAVVAGGVIGHVVANVGRFVATVQCAADAVVAIDGGSGQASAGDTDF